jgi:F-type H+-transporting ATPase subunit gamma
MELVASAKLKKAQDAAIAARPYAEGLVSLLSEIAAAGGGVSHPLMDKRPVKKVIILVACSDRGLCGAYNANLVGAAIARRNEHRKTGREVAFVALAKKAASTLEFNQLPVQERHSGLIGETRYAKVEPIAAQLMHQFLKKDVDLVEVVYSRFITATRQTPDSLTLLPAGGAPAALSSKGRPDYEFLPEPEELLASLIPQTVKTALFSCLLQTSAGEHAARRVAMKNATDAATDMVKSLGTIYNRGRQGKITQEIAEITGAVEAMA